MKNNQIQGLRGISILLVLIYHFFARYRQLYHSGYSTNKILMVSYMGVFFFLMISGYFFEKDNGGWLFIKKKISSLWPKYFVACTIIFLVTRFVELPGRTVGWVDYLKNIFFLNGFIGGEYVDGAHWYMTTMVACIIWYSLILKINPKHRWIAYISWLAAYYACDFLRGHNVGGLGTLFTIAKNCLGGSYIAAVIMGSLIKRKQINIGSVICALTCIFFVFRKMGGLLTVEMVLCAVIMLLVTNEKVPVLANKFLVYIGGISYSMYLIHQNLGFILIMKLERNGYRLWMSFVALVFGILAGFLLETAFKEIPRLVKRKTIKA